LIMMEPSVLDAWAAAMWKACWQGSIVVLAIWLICRIMPSMPARCRCWLWRLAILKFMVVLLLPALVNLPLLPARSTPGPIPDVALQIAKQQAQASPTDQAGVLSSLKTNLLSLRAILALLWILGVGWSSARLLVAWRRARQLRKQSGIIDNTPLIEQLAIQARLYGLRGSPALLEAEGNGSPMLIGILRPAIVVPGGTARKLNRPEFVMVLGHELAHIRRGDLLWNIVAACVRTVFFFHPLVWLSQRQLNLAQEVAADELTILRQHHDPASYGTLLVSVISRLGPSRLIPTMSMGTAGSVQSLTRRLVAMTSIGRASRGVIVASAFLLAATALLGIVPWQLVAAEPKSADDAKSLQGTWQAVDLEANGEKRPDDQAKELQLVFTGDEVFAVKPQGEDPRNKFKLDSSKSPKTIDLIPCDGESKGKRFAGIYDLKDGQLRLCINIFGQDSTQRPTEFKTKAGDGVVFATLKREKRK
jgi:uncharacterized protein (TIGR03067 family)